MEERVIYPRIVGELPIILVICLLLPEKGNHEENDHEWDHVPNSIIGSHVMGPVSRIAAASFNSSALFWI